MKIKNSSNIYDGIQVEANKLWHLQHYELTYEYYKKIYFLPPFSIFIYVGYLISHLIHLKRKENTIKPEFDDIFGNCLLILAFKTV